MNKRYVHVALYLTVVCELDTACSVELNGCRMKTRLIFEVILVDGDLPGAYKKADQGRNLISVGPISRIGTLFSGA